MFNLIVTTAGEIASYIYKKIHIKKVEKLSVLELQQREHSSCPFLGFLLILLLLLLLRGLFLFRCLLWTCQQHLTNITLTSTFSHQSLRDEEGEKERDDMVSIKHT